MSEIWVMWLCVGVTSLGCGVVHKTEYATQIQCHNALATMRLDSGSLATGASSNVVAYCRPEKREQAAAAECEYSIWNGWRGCAAKP